MDFQKELIAEYDRETAKTRKMLEAIPADVDFTFNPTQVDEPGPFSRTRLGYSRGVGDFHSDHRQAGVSPGSQVGSYVPASKEALLERFDGQIAQAKAELAKFVPEKWDENWKLWPAARPGSTNRSIASSAIGCSTT